jgi:PST family polysaccharide transporter
MSLVKTTLLNGIAVMIKMLTMMGINKILAIYVGPTGYATLGQFQNAVQMITTVGSGAINVGVTKYTAEYFKDEDRQRRLWQTAGTIALLGSIVTGVLIALFNQPLASWFLKDINYGSVFIWYGLTLMFFVFNNLLMAILNGKKEILRYLTVNMTGSLFSLAISAVMILKWGLYGALLTLAINQSMLFFVTLALCHRTSWFKLRYLVGRIDKTSAISLGKYTAMALTSAIIMPLSHILVRKHLGETLGWEAAGYWEAMWRLSAAYLMFVTTTLGVYYLPRLSELEDPQAIKNEIIQGYKVILPIATSCGLIIYLVRDFVITTLFTQEFSPMRDLFAWQLLGDALKIASWLLAYILTAKALTKAYIFSEVFFSFLFFGLVIALTGKYGIQGSAISHAVNYGCHFIFMLLYLRSKRII